MLHVGKQGGKNICAGERKRFKVKEFKNTRHLPEKALAAAREQSRQRPFVIFGTGVGCLSHYLELITLNLI